MLTNTKFKEIKDQAVKVLDPHYAGGYPVIAVVMELKDSNGKVVNHVAFDWAGQIHGVIYKDNMLQFDNTASYGSISKEPGDKISGWCYDRDGYSIEGFTSDGYYKESIVA